MATCADGRLGMLAAMITPTPNNEDIPLAAAAKRVRVSPRTLRRWISAGRIAAIRTAAGRIHLPASEVQRLLPGQVQP